MNLVKKVLSFLDRYDELIAQEKRIEQLMMTIVRISPHTASMNTRIVLFREAHHSHMDFLHSARSQYNNPRIVDDIHQSLSLRVHVEQLLFGFQQFFSHRQDMLNQMEDEMKQHLSDIDTDCDEDHDSLHCDFALLTCE